MNDKTKTPDGQNHKTMAEYEAEGRAVRANMEKLRALRLAREAAEAAAAPARTASRTVKKTGAKKAASGSSKKAGPAKLSDWLADQQKGGFRT